MAENGRDSTTLTLNLSHCRNKFKGQIQIHVLWHVHKSNYKRQTKWGRDPLLQRVGVARASWVGL